LNKISKHLNAYRKQLTLLNIADMRVDSTGKEVGAKAKLLDISSMCGTASKQKV
jgi:hypothetical protein